MWPNTSNVNEEPIEESLGHQKSKIMAEWPYAIKETATLEFHRLSHMPISQILRIGWSPNYKNPIL